MRENCTYGLTRGRAYPARGAPLYSTSIDIVAGIAFEMRGGFVACLRSAAAFWYNLHRRNAWGL